MDMEWQPHKTWVFAVGLLKWEREDTFSSFPDAVEGRFDAQLIEFFREQGVPEEQIIYLQDEEATIEDIQQNFPEFLSQTDEDDLLIFYFTGHGDWDSESGEHYFINYDADPEDIETYWAISSIFDAIEHNFNGSKALLMADCCYSGGLIDEVKRRDSNISYACVTSSYAHNSSTGEWTFTESLLKGLQGDAAVDLDEDGLVTLYDFARYAELEVAFIEEQKSMFITTHDFDAQMQLSKVVYGTESHAIRRVEVEYEGEWYKARTLATNDDGEILVKYVIDGSEEWVTEDRIRPYRPHLLDIGTPVEARDENDDWYPATVKKAWYGLHYVSYDDFSDIWDEWVGRDRIRLR